MGCYHGIYTGSGDKADDCGADLDTPEKINEAIEKKRQADEEADARDWDHYNGSCGY